MSCLYLITYWVSTPPCPYELDRIKRVLLGFNTLLTFSNKEGFIMLSSLTTRLHRRWRSFIASRNASYARFDLFRLPGCSSFTHVLCDSIKSLFARCSADWVTLRPSESLRLVAVPRYIPFLSLASALFPTLLAHQSNFENLGLHRLFHIAYYSNIRPVLRWSQPWVQAGAVLRTYCLYELGA